MSLNLPFWVNGNPDHIEKMDLRFRHKKMPVNMSARGYVAQGPFIVSKGYDNHLTRNTGSAVFYLQFMAQEKRFSFELQGRVKEIAVSGRARIEKDKVVVPYAGGEYVFRPVTRSDLAGLEIPNQLKKSMKKFLAWCKERDEDQ